MSESYESFCTYCMRKTPVRKVSEPDQMSVRGVSFEYVRVIGYCPVCGHELYVPEFNDLNVDARLSAYKNALEGEQTK